MVRQKNLKKREEKRRRASVVLARLPARERATKRKVLEEEREREVDVARSKSKPADEKSVKKNSRTDVAVASPSQSSDDLKVSSQKK